MLAFLKKLFSKTVPKLVTPPPKTKFEYGYGVGHRILFTRLDLSLPADLHKHQSSGGTVTWYSRTEGNFSNGEYLRRYNNETWAIHLGTWCTRENLLNAVKLYSESNGPVWEEMHRAAIIELERRIKAITGSESWNS